MKRKYTTEYCLGFLNSYTAMLTAQQLLSGGTMTQGQIESIANCHIYIITARPAPYFKADSIKHENNKLSGTICYKIDGIEKSIEFENYSWKLEHDAVSLNCKYPYKEIISYNAEGKEVTYVAASFLANIFLNPGSDGLTDLNNYEVLYVGQSLGNQGNRNAYDRLKSHSTLQKILSQTGYDYPDKEVMIFMHEFKHENMFTSMDGRAIDADKSDKNEERLMNAIKNPPDKKQKIGMIEAALIRYFQPYYNEMYKIKFPSTKHKILKSCYALDISGLVVELNTENLNYHLYSSTIISKHHHMAQIDLFNSLERRSFFAPTGFENNPEVIK